MKRKIVVWDLFGGSQNSVYKAIEAWNKLNYFEIHTFDIVEEKYHENQHVIDLTDMPNFHAYLLFKGIPKPDIIVASPLCQSFSIIMHAGKDERVAWKFDKKIGQYVIKDIEEIEESIRNNKFLQQNKAEDLQKRAQIGKTLIDNTIRIILTYLPSFFYIENPASSLMWKYIEFLMPRFNENSMKNICHYNSYDLNFTQKPSIFLSNIDLKLKKFNITNNVVRKDYDRLPGSSNNETGDRVIIPKLLLIDIFNTFRENIIYMRKNKLKGMFHVEKY